MNEQQRKKKWEKKRSKCLPYRLRHDFKGVEIGELSPDSRCRFCEKSMKQICQEMGKSFYKYYNKEWRKRHQKKQEPSNVRCGLCDTEILEKTWQDHVNSEQHQAKLHKDEPKPKPKYALKEISEEQKKLNKKEGTIAKAENLGYISVANGRSQWKLMCECGEIVYVYAWKGEKRCPNCWKILCASSYSLGREPVTDV